jgi:YesN/AraC family two-component response regulator
MTYLSKSYFSKMFSDEMGITFSNYITKIRIEKSKQLLLDDTFKLVDVGYLVGFIDQSYFIKCFKKLVGASPGRYRKNHGIIEIDEED